MKAKLKIAAVLTSAALLGGCASTGPNAPKTSAEAVAGGVVGTVGAVGGAVGGAALGVVAGAAKCGPLFIICSPVFAVIGVAGGAVKGGEVGAQAGVKLTRIASAPESPKSASEPSATESSGQSMVIEPDLTPGSDKKAPRDSEKTADLPASAPQLSSAAP